MDATPHGPEYSGLICFFLGLAVGSFLNVVLYRLPLGLSLARPRSRCPHCEHTLAWYELLPVLSYVALRGRCRCCQHAIHWRYPAVELATGLVAGLAGYTGGWVAGAAAIACCFAGALLSVQRRARRHGRQAGVTLVEVLLAVSMLTVVMAPVLDTLAVARHAGKAGERRMQMLGIARARLNEIAYEAHSQESSLASWCPSKATTDASRFAPYVATTVMLDSQEYYCNVQVEVTCPTCQGKYGMAAGVVTATTMVRRK